MSGVVCYLFAPTWKQRGWRRQRVRALKIERATKLDDRDGGAYTPGGMIFDGWIPADKDAPNVCYVIEGKIVGQFSA